jgi:uncharacterized protein YbjT (DUF2867 family)
MTQQTGPVLVTGATGNTGRAIIDALIKRGTPVRAMIRTPADSSRLPNGVPVAVADFDDPASVAPAPDGAERAYLVTPSSERAEAQQRRFADLAVQAGVSHLVVLSQLAADEQSPVRFLRYHAAVEQHVRALDIAHTFLRPNLFFQGLLAFARPIAARGRFYAPIGDARVSAVDVRDIAAVAAIALTEPGHEGATYTLTGPAAVTHAEIAAALTSALGRDITFTDVPPGAFADSLQDILPPWQVQGLLEDYAHYHAGKQHQSRRQSPRSPAGPQRTSGSSRTTMPARSPAEAPQRIPAESLAPPKRSSRA